MASKALGLGGSDSGLSVDAQVGDRENEAQVGGARGAGDIEAEDNATVNVSTNKIDSQIEKAENVTIQTIPPWVFLIALVGWILPTPLSMWNNTFGRLTKIFRKSK
jgi:hypothetical protein